MKRTLDFFASLVGLLVMAPLMAGIALAVLLDDGAPILFRQERIGRGGAGFNVLKFRTMRAELGTRITVGDDQRITRLGQWLRRWKLDELPQLVNVLKGEMSLVGPRPEVPHYVREFPRLFETVMDLRPGITDPASIQFRNEAELLARRPDPERAYREEILPEKIRISAEYARTAGVWDDMKVILQTIGILTP